MFSKSLILALVVLTKFSLAKTIYLENKQIAQNKCQQPNEEEMKAKLKKAYMLNIENIIDGIEYYRPSQSSYESSLISIEVPKNETLRIFGSTECKRIMSAAKFSIQPESICPHHFVEIKREDIYPFIRKHAVCNCENCIFSDDKTGDLKCKPVYLGMMALKRDACKEDGQYEWKAVLEKVPISCSCMQKSI